MSHNYLEATPLLDFKGDPIQSLIKERGWPHLTTTQKIGAAYDFVRNEIVFGYNSEDTLPASAVLKDGYGQCNTKGTLLMGILRALNIPCRFHGFTISKTLQRGIVPELIYPIAPQNIIHSWVEVFHKEKWVQLEGFILDQAALSSLQKHFSKRNSLCAYGVGTNSLSAPDIEWTGTNTYIQKTGINHDFGIFDAPDDFYKDHKQLSGLRGIFYKGFVRHWMNQRVARIRKGFIPEIPGGEQSLLPNTHLQSFEVSK